MPHSLISRRVRSVLGAPNDLAVALANRRSAGATLLDLSVSNPSSARVPRDWGRVVASLHAAPVERYAPASLGGRDAREDIVAHLRGPAVVCESGYTDLGRHDGYHASRLMLTASTSDSYSYLFKLLCDPGDCVLVPEPSYPLLAHLLALEGLRPVPYRIEYDGAWFVDLDSVRNAMVERPRAIVCVSPNNPTASCLSDVEFDALRSLGVPLIVDQVFSPYVDSSSKAPALAHVDDGLVFVLDGLSKRCALPNLKLGWFGVFGARRGVERAMDGLELIGDTYLGPNSLVESAAGRLLEASDDVRRAIACRLRANRVVAADLQRQGAPWSVLHYQGGWSLMLGLPRYLSDDDWALKLLDSGVVVQPGWLYDVVGSSTIVVSLLTEEESFRQGLTILRNLLD